MRRVASAALLVACCAAAPAKADNLLSVFGAWVFENEDCRRIFANDNGRVVFGADAPGPLPGFIVNATSMSNNEYLCSVREFTVRENTVAFTGRCEIGRRTRRQKFAMRELNGKYQIDLGRGEFANIKRCAAQDLQDIATVRAERERFARENETPLDKSRGLWASNAALCQKAFVADGPGRYTIAPSLDLADVAVIISPSRFVTRGSVCTSQQIVANLQTGREYQANYLCSAEGREFPTTERITILDQNMIERVPASRAPTPQRLVRCTPPEWEQAVQE